MKNKKILITAIILIIAAMLTGFLIASRSEQRDLPLTGETELSVEVPQIDGESIVLKDSKNVTAKITDKVPSMSSMACYAYSYSEDELINGENHAIFRGKVRKLINVLINFGKSKEYRCILYIEVTALIDCDIAIGDTVAVLLPFPIAEGYHTSIGSVAENITEGTEGIFITTVYDETSIFEVNDSTLYLNELAKYGLPDGERYLFIETDGGLMYSEDCYPKAKNANGLDDIEKYIKTVLK